MTPLVKSASDNAPYSWRLSASSVYPKVSVPDRLGWLRGILLGAWACASFGLMYFARSIQVKLGQWPLSFWLAAQGLVLFFVLVVFVYAVLANRSEGASKAAEPPHHEPG